MRSRVAVNHYDRRVSVHEYGGRLWRLSTRLCAGLALVVIFSSIAAAQDYSPGPGIWSAGGGRALAGNDVQTTCVGQPFSGEASGGSWVVRAGILGGFFRNQVFWVVALVPELTAAAAPVLIQAKTYPYPADSASLHYRQGGKTSYDVIPMSRDDDSTFAAAIPAGKVQLRGVEYFFEAHHNDQTVRSPSQDWETRPHQLPVRVSESNEGGVLATRPRAYRMVSIPAHLSDADPSAVLQDDLGEPDSSQWRLGRWDPSSGAYREFSVDEMDSFEPGRAFWLITDRAHSIDFTGETTFASDEAGYAVALEPGWNQVGNPFAYQVSLEAVLVRQGSQDYSLSQAIEHGFMEARPLHEWDGSDYATGALSLSPWTGYFVANLTTGVFELIVPAKEVGGDMMLAGKGQTGRGGHPEWVIRVTAEGAASTVSIVEMAGAEEASDGWDPWDSLAPPALPTSQLTIRSLNDGLPEAVQALRRDVRPVRDPGAVWKVQLFADMKEPVVLAWDMPENFPPSYGARLIDPGGATWVDMEAGGRFTSAGEGQGPREFFLAVGTPEWLDAQARNASPLGAHLSMSLQGSNPFRAETSVRLVLPETERISLRVFDVRGRLVQELASGSLPPGMHLIAWNGYTKSGCKAASGIYFFRFSAPGHNIVIRSVLVR